MSSSCGSFRFEIPLVVVVEMAPVVVVVVVAVSFLVVLLTDLYVLDFQDSIFKSLIKVKIFK